MELHVPHYYNDFVCIADKCIDNCCFGGWEINIDEDTVNYYQSLDSEFGKQIVDNLDYTDEYCFKLKDGHCPFLDNSNLCMIYKNLGATHLGVVCAQFPRYTEYYGNIKESGIGLACEEAARIIFKDTNPFTIKISIIDEVSDTSSEYKEDFGKILFCIRELFFKLLNDNKYNLNNKLIIMLNIASKIQEYINNNDMNNLKILANNLTDNINSDMDSIINNRTDDVNIEEFMSKIWNVYFDLEAINIEWDIIKNEVMKLLHSNDTKQDYSNFLKQYNMYALNHTIEYKNLIQYYIYRYFMKAVYDYNVLGKIQLVICNYLIVKELDIVRFIKNNFSLSFQNRMDTIHIFSREIEYSEDNIETLYEEFVFDNVFYVENLTKLLSVL